VVASLLESTGPLLTVLTPLVAVPLTVITFYLRSLREHQVTWHADLVRRIEMVEAALADLRKVLSEFERDYTTKEEWLRECMATRRTLGQLTEATLRVETTMNTIFADPRRDRLVRRVRLRNEGTKAPHGADRTGSGKDDV
jgi:hypothetical protein